jgi:putative peptidoglycan lipid II flippase
VPELASVPSLEKGRVPWPSRVRADVPPHLDRVAARALTTTTPPKGEASFTTIGEVVDALSASQTVAAPVAAPRRTGRTVLRLVAVLVAIAAAVGLAGLGVDLITGMASPPLTAPRKATVPATAPSVVAAPASSAPAQGGEKVLPIVSAKDYDPYGDTREENPQLARDAIDGDPVSAWRTVRYKTAELSGKPGVGLVVDLGAPRPVSVVQLTLVGNGSDISVRASDDPTKAPLKWKSLKDVTSAGDTLVLRLVAPVTARYVLVWFTQLPSADGAYQGGISDIKVRG